MAQTDLATHRILGISSKCNSAQPTRSTSFPTTKGQILQWQERACPTGRLYGHWACALGHGLNDTSPRPKPSPSCTITSPRRGATLPETGHHGKPAPVAPPVRRIHVSCRGREVGDSRRRPQGESIVGGRNGCSPLIPALQPASPPPLSSHAWLMFESSVDSSTDRWESGPGQLLISSTRLGL